MPCAQEGNVLRLVFIDKATLSEAAAAGSDVKACMASCAARASRCFLHVCKGGGGDAEREREGRPAGHRVLRKHPQRDGRDELTRLTQVELPCETASTWVGICKVCA